MLSVNLANQQGIGKCGIANLAEERSELVGCLGQAPGSVLNGIPRRVSRSPYNSRIANSLGGSRSRIGDQQLRIMSRAWNRTYIDYPTRSMHQ